MKSLLRERRKAPRGDLLSAVRINLLQPEGLTLIEPVNVSEGGLCLRLQDAPEVRSLVRFEWSGELELDRAVEVTGRVAWVIQRLDLRAQPPFLYDVGIEFVDAPASLRRVVAQPGTQPARSGGPPRVRQLPAVTIRARQFVPQLIREAGRSPTPWHLVVRVDGAPCFSGRYASERAAGEGWKKFQRQEARRKTR